MCFEKHTLLKKNNSVQNTSSVSMDLSEKQKLYLLPILLGYCLFWLRDSQYFILHL